MCVITRGLGHKVTTSNLCHCFLPFRKLFEVTDRGIAHAYFGTIPGQITMVRAKLNATLSPISLLIDRGSWGTPSPLGFWTLIHIWGLNLRNLDTLGKYFGQFWTKFKPKVFCLLLKFCLRSGFPSPYILWGNSANGVMPPMPRCRLYQCWFSTLCSADLYPTQDLKHEKVFIWLNHHLLTFKAYQSAPFHGIVNFI